MENLHGIIAGREVAAVLSIFGKLQGRVVTTRGTDSNGVLNSRINEGGRQQQPDQQ